MLFGNGDLRDTLEPFVTALGGHWLQFNAESFGPAEYVLAEAFVIAAAMLATGLALCSILRADAPRYRLLTGLILAGLATKSIANAVQFGPDRALSWLTPGAFGGLAIAVLSLAAATGGTRRWQVGGRMGRGDRPARCRQCDARQSLSPGAAAGVAAGAPAELQRTGALAIDAVAARPGRCTDVARCARPRLRRDAFL